MHLLSRRLEMYAISKNYPPEYSVFDEGQTASGATAAILRPISNLPPLFSIR